MKWVARLLAQKLVVYLTAIAVCLLGIFCLFFIQIAPFPVTPSYDMNIMLAYPGANAYTVQKQVTDKVENALSGVSNVKRMEAHTFAGSANITLVLNSSKPTDVMQTHMDVLQAIASSNLPSTVPQANINEDSSDSGLVSYILTSDQLSVFQMNNFIAAKLEPAFKAIPGAQIYDTTDSPIVRISLLPDKLAQYNINSESLSGLLNSAFAASPLGKIYINNQAYLLNLNESINTLPEFSNLIVGYNGSAENGAPIYLRDIADIAFASSSLIDTAYSSYNGHQSAEIVLYTSANANPFQVYKITQNYIDSIQKNLPADLKITMYENQAKNMRGSFTEVVVTILLASALVMLIALIFLGRLRTTLVPIFTIPVCLLGTIAVITLLGLTLNILTLLGMVIAVGLVVDDAIVVVENITRHIEHGRTKYDAILHGTSDIALTIIGITSTLLAVYLPIVFAGNSAFIIFLTAFAAPLAAAVFISGIVALTLTPVMCTSFVVVAEDNSYQKWFNNLLTQVIAVYQKILQLVLRLPYLFLLLFSLFIAAGVYYDLKIPRAFFPNDPDGVISISAIAAPDDTIASLRQKMQTFAKFYNNKNNVKSYSLVIRQDPITGQKTAALDIRYKDRYLHQCFNFAASINKYIKQNNLQNMNAAVDKYSNWGGDFDLEFAIYGNDTQQNINKKAKIIADALNKSHIFSTVNDGVNQPHKQMAFTINYALAARFGLYANDVKQQLATYFGGAQLNNNLNIEGLSVPVVVQLDKQSLENPNVVESLRIYSPATQQYYPLSKFVSLQMVAKPENIYSFNGQPAVELGANIAKGYSISDAIPFINKVLAANAAGLSYQYEGDAEQYLEGNMQTILIFCLGVVCIYFLLAVLFNNIIDPFIILLTVPFSVVSGAFALHIFGDTLNLYSTLALITLVGLITKHGVLIVQFANHKLLEGVAVLDAIINATHDRFRPIIMTTLAMSLGALPLLFSQGVMYVARRDLGMVLICGILVGTLFSLFVIPLVYTLVKKAEGVK